MDHENNATDRSEAHKDLLAEGLYAIERYFRGAGVSEFEYDEELDVFRFPEDGLFAFCEEFADWESLRERGYLN